jgi:hypothetical protein
MIDVTCNKVNPEKLEQLRAWFREVMGRQDEVRETFRREGVRSEQAFIFDRGASPTLIYIVEADDIGKAAQAYRESPLPIDLEHRKVMQAVLAGKVTVEKLFDCALET